MSKNRDYTRYSKGTIEGTEPVESVETVEVMEPVESIETNESMESVETIETVTEDIQTVEVKQEPEIEEPEPIIGVVTDCTRLNVRARPYSTAMILGVITAATELIIIEEESTKDFYKICTSAGLEGYCMKKFITIMP